MQIYKAVLAVMFLANTLPALADMCMSGPIQAWVDLPLPGKQADHIVVTRSIWVTKEIEEAFAWFKTVPLEDIMTKTEKIAAVQKTYMLIGSYYATTGARRMVCQTDGYGAIEQLIEINKNQRIAYAVWNFTSPDAAPIAYGDGEFLFATSNLGTIITWNYQFALKQDHFPGSLGSVGRWLFRTQFADSDWVEFMEQTLNNIKRQVEK